MGGFPLRFEFLGMKNPPDDISQICMTALLLRILLKKAGALTKKPFEIFRCTFLRMQGKNSQLRILQITIMQKTTGKSRLVLFTITWTKWKSPICCTL